MRCTETVKTEGSGDGAKDECELDCGVAEVGTVFLVLLSTLHVSAVGGNTRGGAVTGGTTAAASAGMEGGRPRPRER